ncbi:MAG: protein translocase subunit SecD [bacterium]|nr:protein translocase subunit SecD [bacterium]
MNKVLRAIIIAIVVIIAFIHICPTLGLYDHWYDDYDEDHFWIGLPTGQGFELPSGIAPVGRVLPDKSVKLGLDLKGGIYLVYEVDDTGMGDRELKDAVNLTVEIIRKRVDELGVAEPEIMSEGRNRIIVKLPGMSEPARAKELIGTTAELEFKLLAPQGQLNKAIAAYDQQFLATPDPGGLALGELLEFDYGSDPIFTNDKYDRVKKHIESLHEKNFAPPGYHLAIGNLIRSEDDEVYLELGESYRSIFMVTDETQITGKYLKNAKMDYDQFGKPSVNFEWNSEGAKIFADVTSRSIGRRLAILLDGTVQSAPVIQSRISKSGDITGNFTSREAADLALVLRSGALPAKLWLIREQVVGPSLGHDSIRSGILAALIAFIIVIVLVAFYYHLAGLVADTALILNLIIVMGIMVIINGTLTLPGIAGLILSVAMAIDANVLIYERIREEMAAGKTVKASIDSGYSRAFITILDSNITTLIAGIALFIFGTGPVRGFAVTLSIGIMASMFTAIVVTKAIFDAFTEKRDMKKLYIG